MSGEGLAMTSKNTDEVLACLVIAAEGGDYRDSSPVEGGCLSGLRWSGCYCWVVR